MGDEEIAAGDFAGTLRHVRATPTGFPQRDQLGTLLAEAYACSNTNNFVFGAVVAPWGVRGTEAQLPRSEAQRAALAARVADVLWLETRVLRLFELARPELYVITEGSSSSSSSKSSSKSSSSKSSSSSSKSSKSSSSSSGGGSAELAELAELRQRLERLREWSAAADGRLDAVAAAVASAGGCDLSRPPAAASLVASLAAAPRVPSLAPVAAAAVATPRLPGMPGLPQAMLVVRRFNAAGRVSGANGARDSTLLDLLGQGLLLLPIRFGMGVWRRMDEHAEGGSAMHKRFALLHGAHKRVDLVCTRPALQGRGLQARLLARLCADADADGKGADCEGTLLYLSTSDPRNERYYTRFGFAPVGRFASPHGITTVGMARLPRRARQRGRELVQVGELGGGAGAGGPSTSAPLLVVALGLAAAGALALRRAWAR
jgi:GNAT superfamily N-acetyltransferase